MFTLKTPNLIIISTYIYITSQFWRKLNLQLFILSKRLEVKYNIDILTNLNKHTQRFYDLILNHHELNSFLNTYLNFFIIYNRFKKINEP